MIYAIAFFALCLTVTSSASNFHSPVHIIRPLNDVHAKCEQDVEIFCSPQDQGGDEELHRRLTETEFAELSKSRTTSLKIGVTFYPKDGKEPSQRAKDTKRFLNYGPNIDNCLWNTFDAQKVSNECASALTYFNDSIDDMQAKYDSDSESTRTTYMSISFPTGALVGLILLSIAYRLIACDEDDEEDDDTDSDFINSSEKIAFVAVPLTVV